MDRDFALGQAMGELAEQVRTTRSRVAGLEAWASVAERRLTVTESKTAMRGTLAGPLGQFLLAMYTPQQWGGLLLAAALALWGIVTPEDIRELGKAALARAVGQVPASSRPATAGGSKSHVPES